MTIVQVKPVNDWTDEEIADFLAERVLGLYRIGVGGGRNWAYWCDSHGTSVWRCRGGGAGMWNPCENLNHAFRCLERVTPKGRSWEMRSHDGKGAEECAVWCEIIRTDRTILAEGMGGLYRNGDWEDHAVERAICRAIIALMTSE